MARQTWWWVLALALAGCSADAIDDSDSDVEAEAYPSTFTEGKYRVTALALAPVDTGQDFDGDGTPDNNLPNALTSANFVLTDIDLSPAGFDAQIATAIEQGDLNLLIDAHYELGVLTVDVLSGLRDPESGALTIDPASYNTDGTPLTHLLGEFLDQTGMQVGPADAVLPIPFLPDSPPSNVPLRNMRLQGTADATVQGTLTGLIPAQRLADDVLADLIPPEGIGNLSREQLLNALGSFANLEAVADIDLGNGERAVSCTLSLVAEPVSWE